MHLSDFQFNIILPSRLLLGILNVPFPSDFMIIIYMHFSYPQRVGYYCVSSFLILLRQVTLRIFWEENK
jgi:hypothetical protein